MTRAKRLMKARKKPPDRELLARRERRKLFLEFKARRAARMAALDAEKMTP